MSSMNSKFTLVCAAFIWHDKRHIEIVVNAMMPFWSLPYILAYHWYSSFAPVSHQTQMITN